MKNLKVIGAMVFFLIISNVSFADFSDVNSGDLYYKGIKYLEDNGIINGYEDGTFKPQNEVNRAEMLKIVIGAKGIDNAVIAQYAQQSCFQDVPAGVWYTGYVCYAKEQGWVNGYDGGQNFRPGESINAVEALKIVLEIWGIEYEQNPNIWYKGVVDRAAESNYIPFDITNFGANVRRDQMADMISRIKNDDEGALEDYLGPRIRLKADYSTIQWAMNNDDFNFDPNQNALILTTILTSQEDDEKVFTILQVENEFADDSSIRNLPKTFMYKEEFYTFYYTTSAICILTGDCTPSQLAHIDDILTESWLAADSFSLGEKDPRDGCYYVSDLDFQLTMPPSWGAIHDLTILDTAFWKKYMDEPENFIGKGVVCGGGVVDGNEGGGGGGGIIRIQGK